MSARGRFLVALMLSGLGAIAAPNDVTTLEMRRQKLETLPITIYPEFVVQDSSLPAVFNRRARAQDAIVVSWVDALKGSFRVAQLGVTAGQVWVYIPRYMDLAQKGWRNMQGISGIVYVPEAGKLTTAAMVNAVKETADHLKCTLVVGIESSRAADLFDLPVLCKSADAVTIYDGARLQSQPGSYHTYVDRVVAEARQANSAIKVEVAVATMRNEQATKVIYATLLECADVADRIGIFCDGTAESRESLVSLLDLLRGPVKK